MAVFQKDSRPLFPLIAIVDVEVARQAGWTPVDLAAAYIDGGARFLQLRAKSLSGAAFLEMASRIREIGDRAGAILVVNDRADIARLAGASGVHVGQDDLPPAAARVLLGPDAFVGFSTHTERQIDAALSEPVTYIAVGPVFGTATKATGYAAVGLERVRYAAGKVRLKADPTYDSYVGSGFSRTVGGGGNRTIGLVAIGGLTLDRVAAVVEAGATSVAVITDLLATGDPEGRVRAYLARLAE